MVSGHPEFSPSGAEQPVSGAQRALGRGPGHCQPNGLAGLCFQSVCLAFLLVPPVLVTVRQVLWLSCSSEPVLSPGWQGPWPRTCPSPAGGMLASRPVAERPVAGHVSNSPRGRMVMVTVRGSGLLPASPGLPRRTWNSAGSCRESVSAPSSAPDR